MGKTYIEFLDEPGMAYELRMDVMHQFFAEHPEYQLLDFEPITGGIRAYYAASPLHGESMKN